MNVENIGSGRKAINRYKNVSWIPYNLTEYLFENENIWKLLYYSTNDALSKPNLTRQEKINLIWRGQDRQEDYRVFLTPMQENAQPEQACVLRIFVHRVAPVNPVYADILIGIEMLCQTKLGMLDDGRPRIEVLFEEIMGTVLDKNIQGVGNVFFSQGQGGNTSCASYMQVGNKRDYFDRLTVVATHFAGYGETQC